MPVPAFDFDMLAINTVFTAILALAASVQAEPSKRAPVPRLFNVVLGQNTTLGRVALVGPNPFNVFVSQGEATPLYVDNGTLYGEYPGIKPPHAFLDFPNLGLSCGTVGKVIFGYTNSNKCSVSGPFAFSHDEILYNPAGSFLVCGPNKDEIQFSKDLSTPAGCARVSLVAA